MTIRLLIMDVDGTLTDGKVYLSTRGEVMKAFNTKDGIGISKLHINGIVPVVMTGRSSRIVANRARELGITEIYQGLSHKVVKLKEVAEKYQCSYEEIAYIGDDENDLECMGLCGLRGCPADAVNEVKKNATFICTCNGGNGAVRQFIDYLLTLSRA